MSHIIARMMKPEYDRFMENTGNAENDNDGIPVT